MVWWEFVRKLDEQEDVMIDFSWQWAVGSGQ